MSRNNSISDMEVRIQYRIVGRIRVYGFCCIP